MRRARLWWALLLPISACADASSPLDPGSVETRSLPGVAGIEHVVVAEGHAAEFGGTFVIRSALRNSGTEPAHLRVRTCYLRDDDLRSERPGLALHEPLMLCARLERELTLAPGEVTESLTITGTGPSGASYPLHVRHALEPEHWTEVTLRIP